MIPDFVSRVDIIDKNFVLKSFFCPTTQKNYFSIFQTLNFEKKNFFVFKKSMFKLGCGLWVPKIDLGALLWMLSVPEPNLNIDF